MNTALLWGRVLMADTLAFHIFFALLGVGIPLFVSVAELIGLVRRDVDFVKIAKRWSFAMGVLFVVGAISGTVVAIEFFMLWPGFTAFAGPAIDMPIFLEVFAFFLEAIFLGIYLYTWERWGKGGFSWRHWVCSLPVVVGSLASAFLITTVNAFMNVPSGITTTTMNGVLRILTVKPWQAMFGPAVFSETTHSIFAYYATTAFIAAAMYAWMILRRQKRATQPAEIQGYIRKSLAYSLVFAFVFALLVGWTGDHSARFVAEHEPIKLATIEQLTTTGPNAPLNVLGMRLPGMLSMMVGGTRATVVRGLDSFDPALWPPAFIHILFDLMAASGSLLVIMPLLYFVMPKWRYSKPVLWLAILAAFAAVFSVEAGWIVTEVGRQPFVVAGLMKTAEAFTPSGGVVAIALIFPVLYVLLAVAAFWILIRQYAYHDPL